MTNHKQSVAITKLLPHAVARQQTLRLLAANTAQYQTAYEDCRHAVSYAFEALETNTPTHPPSGITRIWSLPPDPEGINNDRAVWAAAALQQFQSVTGTDFEDALADFLGDAMHWCDRNAVEFDAELLRARTHYKAETTLDPDPAPSADASPETPPPPSTAELPATATHTYRAEFFTAADYASRNFEAGTPEEALQLARQFYDNNCGELDFCSNDDNAGLDQIQIWDNERGTLASWESDDYLLRQAAPELLKQSIRVLKMLPHCGIYNDARRCI